MNRSLPITFTALIITLLVHLYAIGPTAKLLQKVLLPKLSEDSLELELTEIKAKDEKQKEETIIPIAPENTEKQENTKENIIAVPEEKRILDPNLLEDQIVNNKAISQPVEPEIEKKEELPPPQETEDPEKEIESESISPIFLKKPEVAKTEPLKDKKKKKKEIPEDVKKTFREGKPEKTDDKNLEYSINTYKWTFKRYMENWAHDIQKWWKPPLDYAMGRVPEGGNMWIEVRISKEGRLLGYRIKGSDITAEMELKVIQALVGSLSQPPLPDAFPGGFLLVNWHFIYPPIRPEIDLRR